MHSATDSITPTPTTIAQRVWDRLWGRSVHALDVLGEGAAAIVSRFTPDVWGVHFQVHPQHMAHTDAWAVESGSSTVYYLHIGRVEFAFFREERCAGRP